VAAALPSAMEAEAPIVDPGPDLVCHGPRGLRRVEPAARADGPHLRGSAWVERGARRTVRQEHAPAFRRQLRHRHRRARLAPGLRVQHLRREPALELGSAAVSARRRLLTKACIAKPHGPLHYGLEHRLHVVRGTRISPFDRKAPLGRRTRAGLVAIRQGRIGQPGERPPQMVRSEVWWRAGLNKASKRF
jgi:hypothetical protein